MTYYLYKNGPRFNGVFGIFDDYGKAIEQAKEAARMDIDSKHKWKVMEYRGPNKNTDYTQSSAVDKCLYWTYKDGREMITKAPVEQVEEKPKRRTRRKKAANVN